MHSRTALTLCILLTPAWLGAQDRTATVAPDQAILTVGITTPTITTRDEVLATLQGSSITLANFTSVYTTSTYNATTRMNQDQLAWTFTLNVPFSNIKATMDQLTGLQIAVAKEGKGMDLSFALRGTQASAQALAGQSCSASDLIADARTQAQKIAAAAGLSVGAVVGASGTSVVTPPTTGFSSGTYQPSCTITVKFALTGL